MLISKNWLQDFVELPKSLKPKDIAFDLTMKTVEIEDIIDAKKDFHNIVVGKILSVEKHPNADNLKVCKVSTGKDELQVVCGGSNLKEGMKVAFGKIGAKVKWHGEGEFVELKKAKIRNVESYGMICASDEIGLADLFPKKDEKEILDLSDMDFEVGDSLSDAFSIEDIVYDIDNKSMTHRSDLWGHYGIARELSVFYNTKLKEYNPPKIKEGKEKKLDVDVKDKDLCPRYIGVVMDGIKVGPSPNWMQKRLLSVGIRPINNVVDVTNYVMHEYGQPMHAFDYREVDKKIIVRRAKTQEKFTTLDKKEHELTDEMLVIADKDKAIAIAGIMGGENSEIKSDTNSIILESANFNPSSIRKTSVALGLRTDSSARFEKGLDPNSAEVAINRAVELLLDICKDSFVSSNISDVSNFKIVEKPTCLPLRFVESKIGIDISENEIVEILEKLGFGVEVEDDFLCVKVPTWRAVRDIKIAEDLIEEVARIYGFEKIPATLPKLEIIPPKFNKLRFVERKLKEFLSLEHGYTEVYNYSFSSEDLIKKTSDDLDKHIELDNPVAKDRPFLRRSLIPNMLQNVEQNLHRFDVIKIFEIGKVYILEDDGAPIKFGAKKFLPKQDTMLGMVYAQKDVNVPFFDVSESIIELLRKLGIFANLQKIKLDKNNLMHSGRYAGIFVDKKQVGLIGELSPVSQDRLGIPYRTAIVDLNVDMLISLLSENIDYKPLPNYPNVERDLAFVVKNDIRHLDIVKTIKDIDGLIVDVNLFDVYHGKQVEGGKKSMAYHIVYRSDEKTLESKTVDNVHKKVVEALKNNFDAEIRK
jgi:phenylalanyl-tRNA synthetase beta chain